MRPLTVHATVPAPSAAVFNYLADVENLPRWIGGFCEWLELHADGWRAYTALGELDVAIAARERPGEFELALAAGADGRLAVPFRVRTDGEAGSLVSFTCDAGWPEERRAVVVAALVDGLRGLGDRLATAAGPRVAAGGG